MTRMRESTLADYEEAAYLALRLGVAFLFVFHAPQKWLGWFGGPRWPVYSLRGLASLIEAVSSPLIALGLFTRPAAAMAAVEMAGAYLTVHAHLLGRPGWPIENRGELAVLYLLVFAYMTVRGDGRYSLGQRWRRRTPAGALALPGAKLPAS